MPAASTPPTRRADADAVESILAAPTAEVPVGRWQPTPFLWLTALVHLGACGLAFAYPLLAAAVVAGNHALIIGATLWPRSAWLVPNVTRLPESAARDGAVCITLDDGPDPEVTPHVLDVLEAAGAKATFFCIAERVAAHPALAREIVARGHEVANHTAGHRHTFSLLGPRGYARELGRAQDLFAQTLGVRPRFFRPPAGFRNLFLGPVLARLGLRQVCWTRRGFDTREADASRVTARLTRGLAGGDILLLHDGHAQRDAAGTPVVCQVLPRLLAQCQAQGLRPVRLADVL